MKLINNILLYVVVISLTNVSNYEFYTTECLKVNRGLTTIACYIKVFKQHGDDKDTRCHS